jgi:hypothetical protein
MSTPLPGALHGDEIGLEGATSRRQVLVTPNLPETALQGATPLISSESGPRKMVPQGPLQENSDAYASEGPALARDTHQSLSHDLEKKALHVTSADLPVPETHSERLVAEGLYNDRDAKKRVVDTEPLPPQDLDSGIDSRSDRISKPGSSALARNTLRDPAHPIPGMSLSGNIMAVINHSTM